MALETDRQTLELENLIGARDAQVLVRAEALVPGAGRDAIEPLLADASLYISQADLQSDRVVLEGTVSCQAAYRQGEESTLKALAAQTTLNHVIEIPGTQPGMLCRVWGEAVHVDARYENGHMIFQITCNLSAQVLRLTPAHVITGVSGAEGLQTAFREITSVKLAAEATELALARDAVALPAALDARTSLMDWAAIEIESAAPDLGGVRVKGRLLVETLVSSGVAGRPAVVVRYPMALDQLVELPEWLTGDVFAECDLRAIRSQVEPAGEDGDMRLACEAEVRVRVLANATDRASALTDVYATQGASLDVDHETLRLCAQASQLRVSDVVRGTVLLGENAPGVGTVIAVKATPVIGEWRGENGQGRIDGVIEVRVLYLPGGSDIPAAAEAELPFSVTVPQALNERSMIDIQVLSAEANALMSDRLEMKLNLSIACQTRRREAVEVVEEVEEDDDLTRRPGIVIRWPDAGETAWDIGKRYAVPVDSVGDVEPGKPVVVKV